jgi:hypothetical protein
LTKQIGTKATGFIGQGEYDIPETLYHADGLAPSPSLSSSVAKVMIDRTPRHGHAAHPRLNPNFEREEKTAFDLGSAFHKLVLEKGAEIVIVDAKDWRTDNAKAQRAAAYEDDKTPLLRDQYNRAVEMVRAVKAQVKYREELALAMNGGVAERVLIWEEETAHGPIWCRAMLDWIPHGGSVLVDWKSTGIGAGPDDWGRRTIWDMGCDIQDVFYRRGVRKVLGREFEAVLFAVAENSDPFAMMCHRVSPAALAMAERKVQWAINTWGMCIHAGKWPGYPTATAWQDPPPWIEGRWLERETAGQFDPEVLARDMANLEVLKATPKAPEAARVQPTEANPFGLKD